MEEFESLKGKVSGIYDSMSRAERELNSAYYQELQWEWYVEALKKGD